MGDGEENEVGDGEGDDTSEGSEELDQTNIEEESGGPGSADGDGDLDGDNDCEGDDHGNGDGDGDEECDGDGNVLFGKHSHVEASDAPVHLTVELDSMQMVLGT